MTEIHLSTVHFTLDKMYVMAIYILVLPAHYTVHTVCCTLHGEKCILYAVRCTVCQD